MQQQYVCSAFPKETTFIDHIMCGYTCIPRALKPLVIWSSSGRERKFENSAKTDGRERIHHFLQQSYCVTKQQIIPIKRVILVIVMMGKLSARA